MDHYVEVFAMLPFVVVMFQFYSWIVSLTGLDRQKHCRALGITYITLGTVAFVFRTSPSAVVGFILVMLGLRLLEQGLVWTRKSFLIDQSYKDR